jgi:hypothetical protein
MSGIIGFSETINSSTPMERAIAQLVITMQEITNECKEGNVTLCEHATSHMKVLTCNICNIRLTKVNAFLHLGLVIHHVENGLGNSAKCSKIGMKQCSITQMYVLSKVMNRCFNY